MQYFLSVSFKISILFGCCVWKNIVIDESFDVGWYMVLFGTLGPFVPVGGFFFGRFLLDYLFVKSQSEILSSFFFVYLTILSSLFFLVWFY